MARIPDRRLQAMMEEFQEWLEQPADPALLERIGPAYLEEEPDAEDGEDEETWSRE
jgi:hypothetical protein